MTTLPEEGLAYTMAGRRKKQDARRSFGMGLLQQSMSPTPIQHPLQGVSRLAQALVGGYLGHRADEDEKAADEKHSRTLAEEMAKIDPSGKFSGIAKIDPNLALRLAGQGVLDQNKMQAGQEALRAGAGTLGSVYGAPPSGGPTQLGVPDGPAPGMPGGFANNVGNIRATPINWEGKGAPQNGFETFNTPQAGANAMSQNLQAYIKRNPNMTVAQAIQTWAPPNENNTQAYIRGLAESTGINPGMPLAEAMQDPMVAARLMDGIARIEKGGLPQGFNADTFINAAGGQRPGAPPLEINMTPQGSQDGMPPAPSPQGVQGPTMVAPPAIPDVPRPQPSPQTLQKHQQLLQSGAYGQGPEAITRARAAIESEIDRDWTVQRDRARMQFDQTSREFTEERKQQRERDNPKPTEESNKAHAFALRLSRALPMLEEMGGGEGYPGRIDRAATNLPVLGNALAGPRGERFDQLQRDIINAILRKESGAVISQEEFDNARKQYIPQPGDSPETAQLKLENIRTQLKAFADASNRPPESYGLTGQRGTTNRLESVPAPASGAPAPGAVEGGYRFKGGNPADQRNWERVR